MSQLNYKGWFLKAQTQIKKDSLACESESKLKADLKF